MIKMRMRKEDKIDLWQLIKLERGRGQSFRTDGESRQANSDAREERWISENFDAEKIDKHRRMAKPRERDLRVAPRCGLGFGKGRSNRPPTFNRPFTKQMPEPAPHTQATQSWLFR